MDLADKKLQLKWWADKQKIPAQFKGLRDACQIGVEAIDWAQRRIQELLEANDRYLERARAAEAALASTPPPQTHLVGKPTIAVGTYTITELYAGRAVESDLVVMVPADDLTILVDGAEQPIAHQLKINDSVVLAACRAHTPQFDRLDADIARYAKEQMREALTAALKVMEIYR